MKRLFSADRFSFSSVHQSFAKQFALSIICLSAFPLGMVIPVQAVEQTPLTTLTTSDSQAISTPQTTIAFNIKTASPLPISTTPAADPIDSQYSIPWQAIQQAQAQVTQSGKRQSFHYRSPLSNSPNGATQTYSELLLTLHPDLTQSVIQSQLVIINPQQTLRFSATSHLASQDLQETTTLNPGTFSILMPAAWSEDGQSLLIRQFEGLFGSDVATDYAMVWQSTHPKLHPFSPAATDYDSATLMGWSQNRPGEVLFQTRVMGDPASQLVTVNSVGKTATSPSDRPIQIGTAFPSRQASR